MPNFDRTTPPADDLDIAARVMDTVSRQVASYKDALVTLRSMRAELPDHATRADAQEINTPELMAKLLEEKGIPMPLSRAMAAEDFQAPEFQAEAAIWTWDCCCTHCCLTCQMATAVTDCAETFIW